MNQNTPPQSNGRLGLILAIAALVCALIALGLPFVGFFGIVLGVISYIKGGRSLAAVAVGASVLGIIFGIIFTNLTY